ncbi:1,4-alpha-glucan branching protein GlgB [Nocardioides piscis]|uniref:1,4-alpha-glucan branching enzyme GlgB n=1 Tax=Nocardioides piscis TaxID=2714938 RepID=A0A6G7YH46_9ACTN|nr:1,4-alpha-glucan branching protein GlgB [Nocardioides piscis]QIK75958.1 1,4-alpha-glucan branching protein GlgB [Nocardioides piscis]
MTTPTTSTSPTTSTTPTTSTSPTDALGALDIHLIHEGRHEELWRVLGAQVGEDGVTFSVWAPNALEVQVTGDWSGWDGSKHPMARIEESGIWSVVVPEAQVGSHYKYRLRCADGAWVDRADPMARYAEKPPSSASIVWDSTYEWNDEEWLAQRQHKSPVDEPMATYELHLASWRKHYSGDLYDWHEMADSLVPYLTDLGFTHVELMPVMQHPFGGSWGYHVTSYFAPDARFGDPDGLKVLIDRLHQAGIGVILDWVPGHFATDEWALARFDGTPLYEDPNPQRGWHKEWGSHIFNFGRNEVRNFLYANAVYWLEEFHADGLRVDGVASMLYLDYGREHGEWAPNKHGGRENLEAVQFLQEMNATVHKRVPGIVTVAEESTAWPGVTAPTSQGGLGFDLKWNMGWMHDSLGYAAKDPVYRAHHHGQMTFSLVYAFTENYVLPISHDEVVHGKGSLLRKMPGDRWQQLANLRAYLAFMWAHPGKQLLFMGCEFGQESEWAESRELDWWLLEHPEHAGVHAMVRDMNHAYTTSGALWARDRADDGFQWIDANDAGRNVFSFIRRAPGEPDVVCVANFAATPHEGLRLGLPTAGTWEEVLNTDSDAYTGSGVGNLGSVTAVEGAHHGQPAHADIVVPPLATVWFRRVEE